MKKREIKKAFNKLEDWDLNSKETQISKTIDFTSHVDALVFIARITVHAEVLQHHPDITFTHAKVKIKLTTHDVKGLTKKDFALAERIDRLQSA